MVIKFLRHTVAFGRPCYVGEIVDTDKEEIPAYELKRLITQRKVEKTTENPPTKKASAKK